MKLNFREVKNDPVKRASKEKTKEQFNKIFV